MICADDNQSLGIGLICNLEFYFKNASFFVFILQKCTKLYRIIFVQRIFVHVYFFSFVFYAQPFL